MRVKALVLFVVTLAFAVSAWAVGTESVIYNFNNYSGDGYYPYSGLVADKAGNLYGTTYQGGANGLGSVVELSLSGGVWTETLLYSFAGDATGDGEYPVYSPLVFDKAGNLYGTTQNGGSTSCNCGTVFKLTKSGSTWTETILHAFLGYPKDGYSPQAGLSFDSAGALYGTTYQGGTFNVGSVFQLQPSKSTWKYKVIHNFNTQNGGAGYPLGGITQGANGYYYGTTYYGGFAYNAGTIYRLFQARNVWVGQNVFYFLEGGDGIYPDSSLAMDAKGNMYGTTYYGGSGEACSGGCGTVYKLTAGKNNTYTQSVIYSFQAGVKDGQNPYYGAGVILDAKGNLYGTTLYGGSSQNAGTVYELKVSGSGYKESLLWSFDTVAGDGYYPRGGVILFNGNVYGTTSSGGSHSAGAAFEIKP
ncbi:MAG TPA: choice-of-anchor tandem repeat GloVer-containing protein [Terriglobales bacterium]|jgi:uncharacterized repeat protein (TIGR03803 family)|nr:choice-of-anchor tandem repeat GloVer-containing protein [Terriglobales bacterium]